MHTALTHRVAKHWASVGFAALSLAALALAALALLPAAQALPPAIPAGSTGVSAVVRLDEKLVAKIPGGVVPAGRLLLMFTSANFQEYSKSDPGDAPFYEDPQPVVGTAVAAGVLTPALPVAVPAGTAGFPTALGEFPPGKYKVQAVLVTNPDQGAWQEAAGNLYSETKEVTLAAGAAPIELLLSKISDGRPAKAAPGLTFVKVPSALLSAFEGRDVAIDVGVRWPAGVTAENANGRTFPTIYEVPGFSGNHRSARRALAVPGQSTFYVVVNPNNRNGHTLFADSPANGPWGRALTEEIIPALEKQFPLTAKRDARLLRGHSSGGWTVLWLLTQYPDVFGAAWSSSPDPVDLRAFERCNIYEDASMYVDKDGKEVPASRKDNGEMLTTVRQENAWEEAMSPGFTSGQQWGSWMSCWGGTGKGLKNLYDPATGAIDRGVAESMRRYDLGDLLRKDPAKYVPLWRDRIFLTVGTADDFYLNEAVALLEKDLKGLGGAGGKGRITFVPGATHFTVYGSEGIQGMPKEMADWLTEKGMAVRSMPAPATRAVRGAATGPAAGAGK